MTETPPPSDEPPSRLKKAARQAARVSGREYLPMLVTLAFWAVVLAAVGHADTARLLAATVLLRAAQMLVHLTTSTPLQLRARAPRELRQRSRATARLVQLGSLCGAVVVVFFLVVALRGLGQDKIAYVLPFLALGLPARAIRFSDFKTGSQYYRVALAASGLAGAGVAWIGGVGLVGMAIAFGLREWVALAVVRWWPRERNAPKRPSDAPLTFAEVARYSAVGGRRLLTYRLTKNLLTIFGPFGNFAARTGRGLKWDSRLEPYMPRKLSGFILFALATGGGGVALALNSGEPAAMIIAAGLVQLSAIALNLLALWPYLPARDDPNLVVEDDDE